MKHTSRPEFITEERLVMLDELRASGRVNMFAAVPIIQVEIPELSPTQAADLLAYWMTTFSERHV